MNLDFERRAIVQVNYISLSVNSRIVIRVACLLRNVIFVISFFSMFLCCDIFSAVIKPGGLTEYPVYNALPSDNELMPNLLFNSGFEGEGESPEGWTSNGFVVDSTVLHNGSKSYRITDANTIRYAQSARQSVEVNAGIYRIAGWVKMEGLGDVTGGSIRLSLKIGNKRWPVNTSKISGTDDWQYIERQNIEVTEDTIVEIRLECYGEPDGTAWISDVELKEEIAAPAESPTYRTGNELGSNLLFNSGFEGEGVSPEGWTSNGFVVDSTVLHNGSNSYRITDANTIRYAQSARQSVAVNAGIYRIAGWVKVEGLGDVTGGSIRLSLKIGNNSVGTTAKISGTDDWQYIEKQNIIVTKDSIAEFRLECYGEPDGTAWISDVELKEQIASPLDVFLLYPNYRGMLFDDQSQDIRFDVSVNIGASVRGYYVEGQIIDEVDNNLIASDKFYIQTNNFIATFDGSVLENEHTYLVIFRLMDEAGIKYEYPAYRISKLPGVIRPLMTMSFDEHNRFLVRGEPTFILGLYDSGMGYSSSEASWENDLFGERRRLFDYPLNLYINYWYGEASAKSMTAMMNVLQRHKILYLQTGNCFGENYNQDKFMIDKNDSYLQALSDHPGLGGFYTVDECYPELAPAMFAQYQRLKAFDPDGITFGASTSPESLFFWRDVCDVLSTDPYPLHWNNKDSLGNYRLSKVADWTRETKETLKSSRPFCTVIQFFQFTSRDRWPTRDELRNMSYMAIVEGANGLFYWTLGQKALAWVKDETKKAEYSESLKAVMWELKDIELVLVSLDRPELLVENSNPSAIRTRVKESNGVRYIFAYNYTNEPIEVRFTWQQAIKNVQVYNESRSITPTQNAFTDAFGPYQAHVYEIYSE